MIGYGIDICMPNLIAIVDFKAQCVCCYFMEWPESSCVCLELQHWGTGERQSSTSSAHTVVI
jgi:hypothetical protein